MIFFEGVAPKERMGRGLFVFWRCLKCLLPLSPPAYHRANALCIDCLYTKELTESCQWGRYVREQVLMAVDYDE